MIPHKDEALKAIAHVRQNLLDGPLDPLEVKLAVAVLEYASEQVEAIEELRRARRKAKET